MVKVLCSEKCRAMNGRNLLTFVLITALCGHILAKNYSLWGANLDKIGSGILLKV